MILERDDFGVQGSEAVKYIESIAWMGSRLGLERTEYMLQQLGNPERKLKFVHLAGTNGKGSTSAMISSVLRAAGFCTGLYISPFLEKFNERMQIDGEMISDDDLGRLTEKVKTITDNMEEKPTEFEIITCVALMWYAERKCDIVVLETGLGGRLDATNVIPAPAVTVITNIGFDHTAILGDTIEKIAGEKAGIIKRGSTCVMYEQSAEAESVIAAKCHEEGVSLKIADFSKISVTADSVDGQVFDYGEWKNITIKLLGAHQRKNAAVAIETVEKLRLAGYAVSDGAVYDGLAATRWPGRFEILSKAPYFVADGGHNTQCIASVVTAMGEYFPGQKASVIMGVLADKDYEEMTDMIAPLAKAFYTVTPDSPRALSAAELGKRLERYGAPVTVCQSVSWAVTAAFGGEAEDGLILSVGSLYMTGEIRACVRNRKKM